MTEALVPTRHPALDLMQELWMQGLRAKEISEYLAEHEFPEVSVKALARYGQRNWSGTTTIEVDGKLDTVALQTIVDEAEDSGFAVKEIAVTTKTGWGWEKQPDSTNLQVQRDTTSQIVKIVPTPKVGGLERAEIPAITINVPERRRERYKSPGIGLAVSIPDTQIGYFRGVDGRLTPSQDEAAINVALQVLAFLEETEGVDIVILQGDMGDFPDLSTHRSAPGFLGHLQPSINRIATLVATVREICPDAEIVYLIGNHEARLVNKLTDTIPSLVGLARAHEETPVMSLDYLCRFDDYNVTYIPDYPTGEYWANQGLRFEHGALVSSAKGATAAKHLAKGVSTVYGHTHRQELVWGRKTSYNLSYQAFAGSAGCLAKIDGQIPSSRTSVSSTGNLPTKRGIEDWQQGIMPIYFAIDGMEAWPQIVTIDNGHTVFRGTSFISTVTEDGDSL